MFRTIHYYPPKSKFIIDDVDVSGGESSEEDDSLMDIMDQDGLDDRSLDQSVYFYRAFDNQMADSSNIDSIINTQSLTSHNFNSQQLNSRSINSQESSNSEEDELNRMVDLEEKLRFENILHTDNLYPSQTKTVSLTSYIFSTSGPEGRKRKSHKPTNNRTRWCMSLLDNCQFQSTM